MTAALEVINFDQNVRSILLSNKVDGATDKNPLATAILHKEPEQIAHRLPANQRAHLVSPLEEKLGEGATDAAYRAGCSGHEDRVVVFMFRRHVADLGLRSKDAIHK